MFYNNFSGKDAFYAFFPKIYANIKDCVFVLNTSNQLQFVKYIKEKKIVALKQDYIGIYFIVLVFIIKQYSFAFVN